jgi:hypothetical protein
MMVGPQLALNPQEAEFELFPELKLEFAKHVPADADAESESGEAAHLASPPAKKKSRFAQMREQA